MTDLLARFQAALVDRYTVERELGHGGMAFVFLAHDRKHRRAVAIKVLRPELAAMIGADLFLREIEIAARLSHAHILPLFDSGEVDGLLYYVMPYVEGNSLRDRLTSEGQLPIDETLQIACEVADALAYAHGLGIVHRDIKPENILFRAGHAVVTDFGIAKAVTAAAKWDDLAQTGFTVGTPAYMSPEQAAGDKAIDGRSDLYSLGCVLFEMLTGEPPFTGPTPQAVIAKRFSLVPPEVTKLRPAVPLGLSNAIGRLLTQTPADRYKTASDLLGALKAGDTLAAPKYPVEDNSIAVLPFANMSAHPDNEYFSDGITEEIIIALSRLDSLRVASRTSSFSFKNRGTDLRTVSAMLNVRYVLEGSVRRAESGVRIAVQLVDAGRDVTLWSERYDRQITDIFLVQDEIATTIAQQLHASLGGTRPGSLVRVGTSSIEAYEEYLKGRHFCYQRGPALINAVTHFQRATEQDPGFVAAHAGLAESYCVYATYGLVPQSEAGRKAREAVQMALALDSKDAEVQYAAADVANFFDWDLQRAEQSYREAIRINPRHAHVWARLATMNGLLGRLDAAREAARRAHEADPVSPVVNALAATALLYAGQYGEAMGYADQALEIEPRHMIAQFARGYCHLAQGRIAEAIGEYRAACTSHLSAPALSGLAAAYACGKRIEEAEATLDRLVSIQEGRHPGWWECLPLVVLGRLEKAVDSACRALRGRHWYAWASGCQPMLEPITEHPRWQAEMEDLGLRWIMEARLRHNATISRS